MHLLQTLRRQYQTLESILTRLVDRGDTTGDIYLELYEATMAGSEVYRQMLLHELQRVLRQGVIATQPKTSPELIARFAELSAATMKHEQAIEVLEEYLAQSPLDEHARRAVDTLRAGLQAQAVAPRQP